MADPVSSELNALVRKLSEVSVLRFGIVGVSNTAIGFALFWSLHHVLRADFANAVGYGFGMLWSYYWNRRWTFKSSGSVGNEATRFFTLQIGFLFLSSGLVHFLNVQRHLNAHLSWFVVSAFITVLNFAASRYWAFKTA